MTTSPSPNGNGHQRPGKPGTPGCRCRGEGWLRLEAPELVLRIGDERIPLDIGGVLTVECPWCNPRVYLDRPWTDRLAQAMLDRA